MFDSLVKIFRKSLPVSPDELAPLRLKIETMLEGSEWGTSLRGWVECRAVSLYLRVSRRHITDLGVRTTLELGTITVRSDGPGYQQRVICKAALTMLEGLAKESGRILFIDTVLNDDLHEYLRERRHGYESCNDGHSYFWVPDDLQTRQDHTLFDL